MPWRESNPCARFLPYSVGNINQALSFDGVDDYIEADSVVADYALNGNFSISVWVKPDAVTDGTYLLSHLSEGESWWQWQANFWIGRYFLLRWGHRRTSIL